MRSVSEVLIMRDQLLFGWVEGGVNVAFNLGIGKIFEILLASLKSQSHVGCQPTKLDLTPTLQLDYEFL